MVFSSFLLWNSNPNIYNHITPYIIYNLNLFGVQNT